MNPSDPIKLGMVNRPYPGQADSGDMPFYYVRDGELLLGLVDSLGHGEAAHAGSMRIKAFLDAHWHTDISRLLESLNAAMAGGIGAAIGMAHVSLESGSMRWAGVGNVIGSVSGPSSLRLVNRDGVLGQHYRTPVVQETVMSPGDKLILVSDGMQERLFTNCSPSEFSQSPRELADFLLRHFGKPYDDASCLVYEY